MADTRQYGHQEILRYLQQQMSSQEMHDFEKALMNDPFLADALEGFIASDKELAAQHLLQIEQELTGIKEKGRVVEMPAQKPGWWKVAAIILVISSASYLTFSLFKPADTNKSVVQQTSQPASVRKEADSIGPVQRPLAKAEPILPKEKADLSFNLRKSKLPKVFKVEEPQASVSAQERLKTSKQLEESKANDAYASAMVMPRLADSTNAEGYEARKANIYTAPRQNEFTGRVVDSIGGSPIAGAILAIENTNIKSITDTKGNFRLYSPDSVLLVIVAFDTIDVKRVIIKKSPVFNKIALNQMHMH